MNWNEVRDNYPLAKKYTYLDSARTGAISAGTANTLKAHVDDFLIDGALHRDYWIETKEQAREKAARTLDANKSEIGFLTDVSTGMSLVAAAAKQYQSVLLVKDDFPSVGIPWIRSGYQITWVEKETDLSISMGKIEDALKKGIDILAISWVQYNSGYRIDLGKLSSLCHQYGTKLLVDGTQGFCALPVSPSELGIDLFVASAFKWVTGGYGIAIIYMGSEFRKNLKFQAGGWNSLIDFFGSWEGEENYKSTSEFVEMAHPKYANLITLNHALRELHKIGLSHVQTRVMQLSNYLQSQLQQSGIETLSNYDEKESSGIRLMRGNKELFERLEAEKVKVTFREDYFRVSPHFYNTESDIDKLIEVCLNI